MPATTSTSGLLHVKTSSYYLRATKTNKRLNNCMHASTRTTLRNCKWSQSCSSSKKLHQCQRWTQKIFWTSRLLFCQYKKHFVYYTFTKCCDFIISVCWLNAYWSLRLFTTFLLLQHAIYLRSVKWSWCLLRCPELIQLVSMHDMYCINWECLRKYNNLWIII